MVTHVQGLGHGSGTLHSMGSHDWLLNMATKRWHQYLRVSQPRNAASINYQVAPALPGGCVSGCSCWRAPVPVSLGASGSNPLQVCDRQRSDAPARTQAVNACSNGMQMRAFTCAMAHAKARGQRAWGKGAPLWSALLIFSAMHSRAEDFLSAAIGGQGAYGRHT